MTVAKSSETRKPVRPISRTGLLRITKEVKRISDDGQSWRHTLQLSNGVEIEQVGIQDPDTLARLKYKLPPEKFNAVMQLRRLAIAIHMIPDGLSASLGGAIYADPYRLSPEQYQSFAHEAHELTQIIDDSDQTLYVRLRSGERSGLRSNPVGLLRAIGVQPATRKGPILPYVLLEAANGGDQGVPPPGIRGMSLYQEVQTFAEAAS